MGETLTFASASGCEALEKRDGCSPADRFLFGLSIVPVLALLLVWIGLSWLAGKKV